MSTTRSDGIECWIFPLRRNEAPAKKTIANLKTYIAIDELVIPVSIMRTFRAKKHTGKVNFTYEIMFARHQQANKKIEVKDMKPFGMGAFAGAEGLVTGDMVVYSGVYALRSDYDDATTPEQVYLSDLTKELYVDAKNIVNKARYFQHLQSDSDPVDVSFTKTLGEPVAVENVYNKINFFSIHLQECKYIIPVMALAVTRIVKPREIVGYTYGHSYWISYGVTPSLFNQYGVPIKTITMKMVNENMRYYQYGLNRAELDSFQEKRYTLRNAQNLLILPQGVSAIPAEGTNGVFMSALYLVSRNDPSGIIRFIENKASIFFFLHSNITDSALAQLFTFLENFGCNPRYSQSPDQRVFLVAIKDLAQLSVTQAEAVFAALNQVGDCKFEVNVSVQQRKKIASAGNPSQNGFFAPADSQQATQDEKAVANDSVDSGLSSLSLGK
jgi:hypothetical protein